MRSIRNFSQPKDRILGTSEIAGHREDHVSTSSQSLLGQQTNGMSQLISEFPASPHMAVQGDLRRPVYGILGVPFDALDVQTLLDNIVAAVSAGQPFLISTPNVNFLMASRTNPEFRESLLQSDLCLVDGMPIIWIARLLGLPIGGRLAGSDLFDTLKSRAATGRRLKVFLFGGGEGVAEGVAKSLNLAADGMECVGTLNPGFGSVEELSRRRYHRCHQFKPGRSAGGVSERRQGAEVVAA